MKLTYYGVRGSIPAPGPETTGYGGNTSCVTIEAADRLLIFDAGSGIRKLGNELLAKQFGKGRGKADLFISHTHWDHIQGLPFFVPVYIKGNELTIFGEQRLGKTLDEVVEGQQEPPNFPEGAKLMSTMNYAHLKEWDTVNRGDIKVTCARLNHPNGVYAYRVQLGDKAIVYATDTEHYAAPDWKLLKLAEDADVLIYDGQYTPEEYPKKIGWGHSTYVEGARIAKLAGVKELHLFHHDPSHDDRTIDEIVLHARELFPNTFAAREGSTYNLVETRPLLLRPAQ